jgi:hypothetical protein
MSTIRTPYSYAASKNIRIAAFFRQPLFKPSYEMNASMKVLRREM